MTRLANRPRVTDLSWGQLLELVCGGGDADAEFNAECSNFGSEEERRAAWEANRERLLDWSHGQPWAAERYD